jgi:hypothetical protein
LTVKEKEKQLAEPSLHVYKNVLFSGRCFLSSVHNNLIPLRFAESTFGSVDLAKMGSLDFFLELRTLNKSAT